MSLATLIPLVLKGSIFASVFALGLEAGPHALLSLFRRPLDLLRSTVAMYVIMPIVAVVLATRLDIPGPVKIALIVLSVSPIPPLLPKKQVKSGGTEDYSVGLLVAASALAIVVVPLVMSLFEGHYANPEQRMPASVILKVVATTIFVPLLLGLLVQRLAPAFAARVSGPLAKIATVALLVAVLPVLFVAWPAVKSILGTGAVPAFALFVVIGLATGHLLAPRMPGARSALALSTACRHPGVAATIVGTTFPGDKSVMPALVLYLLVSAILTAPYVAWSRRRATAPTNG